MQLISPLAAVLLLVPAWGFGALALMADAPGEWGRGALIAWTALAAVLLAGAGLQAGASPLAWAAILLGFAAVMLGGPPGLAVAAGASLVLLGAGGGVPGPWWLPVALALPAAIIALRHALAP